MKRLRLTRCMSFGCAAAVLLATAGCENRVEEPAENPEAAEGPQVDVPPATEPSGVEIDTDPESRDGPEIDINVSGEEDAVDSP